MVSSGQNLALKFIYGTAWKAERTRDLVEAALSAGFLAIDTANQPKHYNEAAVGEAIRGVDRSTLYLQTKYTSVGGQDHRRPYDAGAPLAEQVRQSFASSLEHLGVDFLDSYLVHGPIGSPDWSQDDVEVWSVFEELYRSGAAKSIGVSNVNTRQLKTLVDSAEIKPMSVQNRCFAARGWDAEIRALCREHGIVYQGFSLLTANPQVMRGAALASIASRLGATPAQVVFAFSRRLGILPLTGTTSVEHMREDLASSALSLSDDDVAALA